MKVRDVFLGKVIYLFIYEIYLLILRLFKGTFYPGMCLEGLQIFIRDLIQESRYPVRDSNLAYSEYKSTALPLQQPDR
jgi:hypothetical protein